MKNIKIKMFLILCIVILLSSCKRNNGIFTLISPYKYQVEYCGNKIIISKITNTGDTTSTIWKKRNGEYFDENNQKALFDLIDQVEDSVKSCRDNGKSRQDIEQDIEFEKYLDELDEP